MSSSTASIGLAANTQLRGLSDGFRAKRDNLLRDLLRRRKQSVPGRMRIIDLGGTGAYWKRVGYDFLAELDAEVLCVNMSVDEFAAVASGTERVSFTAGNACALSHADNSFDFVHSNSVIEHVGRWAEMRAFAGEVRRLAPDYYVQTPYFWFPVDPHFYRVPFYHWLPQSLQLKLLQRVQVGWVPAQPDLDRRMSLVESSVLLDKRQFASLFPDADISFERVALLPKSLIAARSLT